MAVQMVGSSAHTKVDCLALPTAVRMDGSWAQMKAETTADYLALSTAARMGESWDRMKAETTAECLAGY